MILLPEIPYDIDKVAKCLNDRIKKGKKFSILAVAEGAISKEEAALSKKERKKARENFPHPSHCVPHRRGAGGEGGQRDPGVRARTLPAGRQPLRLRPGPVHPVGGHGGPVCQREALWGDGGHGNGQCVPVPLKDVAGKLKSVPVDCDEIRAARQIGISFGDQ